MIKSLALIKFLPCVIWTISYRTESAVSSG
jgi:hypothetical protein